MTEKRFEYIMFDGFTDNLSDEEYISPHQVAKLLNQLWEENKQLQSSNMEYEDALARLEEELKDCKEAMKRMMIEMMGGAL